MMHYKKYLSDSVQSIPPSGIRKFFDLVAETKGVISLGVGEPDFVTPWHIREYSIYSLEKGMTNYSSNYGMLELREEIVKHAKEEYDLSYDVKEETLVTVGVSEAMDLALRSIVNPGDEVLVIEPCYVSYKPCTTLAGGVPIPIQTKAENNFKVTPEELEVAITSRTKAIVLSYPNNPTGATMTREDLLRVAEVVEKHDLIVISDEIYDKLTYEGEHTCFASLPGMRDRTILLNGFSKAYAMTGWRIGYALANPEFIAAMVKIHQYTMLCCPMTAQMAAIEALRNGKREVEKMAKEFNQRRRLVHEGFNKIGLDCFEPKGAFYAFPSVKSTGFSAEEFAEKLLVEEKVAVVPGTAFGESGAGHIRCSYASSFENLKEALERMERFIKRHAR